MPRNGAADRSTDTNAGIGPLIFTGDTLTVAEDSTVTAVIDRMYGTIEGAPAVINPDGISITLPDGTLSPIGSSVYHLLTVDTKLSLYALRVGE